MLPGLRAPFPSEETLNAGTFLAGGAFAEPAAGPAGEARRRPQAGPAGRRFPGRRVWALFAAATIICPRLALGQEFDLVLKGGHVIDARNGLSAVRDVAVKDGRIATVASDIAATRALKAVDVTGLFVVPGLIDLHAHVYRPTVSLGGFRADNNAVYPDGFSFRSGVTTFVDPGGAGWRNFEDMKDRVIDRSKTRVLAFINIVGRGSAGGRYEQDLSDMEVKATADMALKHKGLIVGVKSAHYSGPEWDPFTRAVEVGDIANIPVMIDFGSNRPERPVADLLTKVLRPGDIYSHVYSGIRGEQDPATLRPAQALIDGRRRGVLFDVGHGGGSFRWRVAVPMMEAGFRPDTISTDLHAESMNAGLKDILDLMGKFLAMGMPLDEVVAANTWNAARAIRQEQLGNFSAGSAADVAVLRLERGSFGFVDMHGARLNGTMRLRAELTVRAGRIVYDLNGLSRPDWKTLPPNYRNVGDPRWDEYAK
jgi:dihydroorotase